MTETLPSLDLSQTAAAAREADTGEVAPLTLVVNDRSWPLAGKISIFKSAQMNKAIHEEDLFGIVEGVAGLVVADQRKEVKEYLLADREEGDAGFVDLETLLDAFSAAQVAQAGRPPKK